ncbi:MAG: HAMP domain-containing histidine kinase [Candidatus Krumholzibacteriota bacterium]|nr:HAMP domain-containing histidine kinase [Candidatus Krumholzibacteriota bacterium]
MKAAVRETAERVEPVAAVARFLAGFAHRIKSPLTGVRGYGELMAREDDGDRRRYWGERLAGGLESLDRIIEGARRYQLPGVLERRHLCLATLVEEAWRLALQATPGAAAKNCRLELNLDPGAEALVDPFHFRNLLVNLLQNALDAAPAGGCIRVDARPGELLGVADAGPGLEGLDREAILTPFFTTRPDRAGLGLPVAAAIAAAHGFTLDWQELRPTGLRARVLRGTGQRHQRSTS